MFTHTYAGECRERCNRAALGAGGAHCLGRLRKWLTAFFWVLFEVCIMGHVFCTTPPPKRIGKKI